ncbi:hypothetical protein BBJ28_00014468 [Nothophytophthora sp. Chile5]|nr:hypothetical protein BBJ28_00014468 [Nothophytophthora sp. Chile5]
MGDRQDASGAGSEVGADREAKAAAPRENPAAMNAMMSGIDWSIFKDGEEDAFGWLLRTNATTAPLTPAAGGGQAGSVVGDLSSDMLPLDDIEMDRMLAGAPSLSQQQQHQVKGGIAAAMAASAGGSQAYSVPPSTAHALAAQLYEGLRSSTEPSSTSMLRSWSVDGSYEDFDDEDDEDEDEAAWEQDQQDVDAETSVWSATETKASDAKASSGGGKVSATTSTRGKAKPRTTSTAKSKRPVKRKKSDASSPLSAATEMGGEDEGEKKQQRRVKNLVSVREFRKRKMKQLEQNEARLHRLEAENMDLKMRLKIGKEAILSEQREKQQIKEQMREMLQRNATEQEIARFLNMYKVTYSDYGPKRREKLHFHLSRIRELLLPTQVTKLCLYSVEQGVDMLARDHVIKEDPMSAPDSATATMSLWGILADELEVSDAQQRQILERRAAIKKVRDDLNHTLSIVKQLEDVTDEKNTALEAQVAQLQQILTPSQATKFIIWVKENPAFMYMLDKLVDSTLQPTESAEE